MLILVLSIPLIAVSADRFVEGASKIAKYFGVSELVIGLTIVSWGTSAPELAVTTISAFNGEGALALGNVVGSNVFNVGLILGFCAVFRPVMFDPKLIKRELPLLMFGTALVATLVSFNQGINRVFGIGMVTVVCGYMGVLYFDSKKETKSENHVAGDKSIKVFPAFLVFLVGLFGILFCCKAMVESATFIAESFGLSRWLIAVTIVAAGTSMPEFAASFTGILKGKHDIAAGNIMGSELMNCLGVLGTAAILSPYTVGSEASWPTVFTFLTILFLFLCVRKKLILSRRDGMLLMGIGLSRWVFDIYNTTLVQ